MSTTQLQQVEALLGLHRYDEAAQLAAELVAGSPNEPRPWCLLSQAQLGARRPRESLAAAERAAALAPDTEWPHRLMSNALRRLGRGKDAVRSAQESLRIAPHNWLGHLTLASAAAEARKPDEAIAAAYRAVDLAPAQPDAHAMLGYVLMRKDPDTAERMLLHALELDPAHAEALNNLAVVRLRKRRTGEAMRDLHRAVVTDPRLEVARRNVDRVVDSVLYRVQWWIALAALYVGLDPLSGSHRPHGGMSWTARSVSVLVVAAIVCAASWRRLRRIPAELRPYTVAYLRTQRVMGASAALSACALVLFCVIAVPVEAVSGSAAVGAFGAAASGLALQWLARGRRRLRRRRTT